MEGDRTCPVEASGKRALLFMPSDAVDDVALSAACTLLANGCRAVLVGESISLPDLSQSLRTSCRYNPEDLHVVNLDSHKPIQNSVEDAVEAGWNAFGGIEVLLTFSSLTGQMVPFLETNIEHLETALTANLKYAYLFSIALVKKMQQADMGGSVIFVTSVIGTERGLFPGASVAGASIAAVNHLTRAMAMELGKFKIRVNAIARGLVKTDVPLKRLNEDIVKTEGDRIVPLKRWADGKKDLSAIILYLAGDMSSFMTGTVIFVDGGQSLVRPRMRSFL